jgi:hypothetical protein
MPPQQQIQTLESLGVTRYRIACDTGINEKTLCNWLNGKTPMKSNGNVKILNDYYEKLMKGINDV